MKAARRASPRPGFTGEVARLRGRLAEAEESLRAIRNGEVDAVVVAGRHGPQVFTLEGAEHAYRTLIESMNEGALTLTADAMILYANRCFARLVKCPLEQVTAGSFRRFLGAGQQAALRALLRHADQSGAKLQVRLTTGDGAVVPAQISVRLLARRGSRRAIIGMVVTDLTEARRTEELLRALSHRLVQLQEAERRHVALELHDRLTQLHCAIHIGGQVLAAQLSPRDASLKREARRLCELAGKAAAELESISRDMRPSLLDQLGLVAALRAAGREFAERTAVAVKLGCAELTARAPPDTELALYRIFQEALKNVQQHAGARRVTVQLAEQDDVVLLRIKDDGIGFDPAPRSAGRKRKGDLGLLGMRERATSVGGALTIKSARRVGTEIEVRVPVPPRATVSA